MKFVPLKIRNCFVEAFKRFPDFVFIWKYEKQPDDAELFNNSTNVHPLEWIPQWDLLSKMFVERNETNFRSFQTTSEL